VVAVALEPSVAAAHVGKLANGTGAVCVNKKPPVESVTMAVYAEPALVELSSTSQVPPELLAAQVPKLWDVSAFNAR
jgi:hypothetical protein